MTEKPTERREREGANEASESKHSFMPIAIATGVTLFLLGLAIFGPLAVFGLIILVLSLLKVFKDDNEERFSMFTEKMVERWPLERVGKEKLGVWVFLSSEIILFGGLLISYGFVRANSVEWPNPLVAHNVTLGTVNTIILLTSSLTMILALYYIREGNSSGMKASLIGTFLLGATFLGLKLGVEWPAEIRQGFTIDSGLPGSTYYMLTGVHAMHVAVGLIAVGYLLFRAFSLQFTKEKHVAVEHVGLYWHFVDIVWMFLFTLFYLV